MCCMRFIISASYRKVVECHVKTAQRLAHVRQVPYLLSLLAGVDGQSVAQVACVLRVPEQPVATWIRLLCCYGPEGGPRRKAPGRPPQLTPTPKAALVTVLEEGPGQAGFSGAGWRSPMLQPWI